MQRQSGLIVSMTLILIAFLLAGCGETVRGAGKDCSRVYRGVKTIFVSG